MKPEYRPYIRRLVLIFLISLAGMLLIVEGVLKRLFPDPLHFVVRIGNLVHQPARREQTRCLRDGLMREAEPAGQLDQARASSESADAQVRSAENRRDASRLQLSYTRLTAPAAPPLREPTPLAA